MKPVRVHRRVYDDIDDALLYTRERFGSDQVPVYAQLIVEEEGIKAPHGYIYKLQDDVVYIARLVHLARYLPELIPDDF